MTDAVIVIKCRGEDIPEVIGTCQGAIDQERWPVEFFAAIDGDAQVVLDVFHEPESGGGLHLAKIEDDGWALEHSLRCRKAGLLNCPLTREVAEAFAEGDLDLGIFSVSIVDGEFEWEERA